MPDHSVRVEYNQALKPLEALVATINRPGQFFVHGAMEIPLPKVEIDEVGVLSFPIREAQVKSILEHASRAPYGRGPDTILDESVRKVWQIAADKVRISGKSWDGCFRSLLENVAEGLGCDLEQFSAELYKFLVYDSGGFFLPHRDTEKSDGMFGTLIVVLPSAHRGGELVIRHAGQNVKVDMSGGEVSEISFAAFYADCEHEVRPILAGYRVCLVYNLIQRQSVKNHVPLVCPPDYQAEVSEAGVLLREAFSSAEAPTKIAWLLEHQYSPDGLSFSGLKSVDAPVVSVLAKAAEQAGCMTHLGIVHIEEYGAANPDYDGFWDGQSEEDADFEIIEIDDWHHYIDGWRNQQGETVGFGQIPLAPRELLPSGAFDDVLPDEQRLLEASGNEGASFERTYHAAALVIWRRDHHANVLLQAGVNALLPYLEGLIEAFERNPGSEAKRAAAVEVAELLLAECGSQKDRHPGMLCNTSVDQNTILRLINRIGDVSLIERCVREVVSKYEDLENERLIDSALLLGAEKTRRIYAELVRCKMIDVPFHCMDLFHSLVFQTRESLDMDWRGALTEIADAMVSFVGKIQQQNHGNRSRRPGTNALTAELLAKFLNSLRVLGSERLCAQAAEAIAQNPCVFDPVKTLVPAIEMLDECDLSVRLLWEHSVDFLLQRSAVPPAKPVDWRMKMKRSCSCDDCGELEKFCADPTQLLHRFRMREDRRHHLQSIISSLHLDMDTETEQRGSPKTLVCRKNRSTYQRRCMQYREDICALRKLVEFAAKWISAPEMERIRDAINRASEHSED